MDTAVSSLPPAAVAVGAQDAMGAVSVDMLYNRFLAVGNCIAPPPIGIRRVAVGTVKAGVQRFVPAVNVGCRFSQTVTRRRERSLGIAKGNGIAGSGRCAQLFDPVSRHGDIAAHPATGHRQSADGLVVFHRHVRHSIVIDHGVGVVAVQGSPGGQRIFGQGGFNGCCQFVQTSQRRSVIRLL